MEKKQLFLYFKIFFFCQIDQGIADSGHLMGRNRCVLKCNKWENYETKVTILSGRTLFWLQCFKCVHCPEAYMCIYCLSVHFLGGDCFFSSSGGSVRAVDCAWEWDWLFFFITISTSFTHWVSFFFFSFYVFYIF